MLGEKLPKEKMPGEKRKNPEPKWLKPLTEYVPILAFFIAYWHAGILYATQIILITTAIALIITLIVARRLPLIPVLTASIVGVFGGLTLWFEDETFIKMKPTIIQVCFAIALGIGLFFKKNWLKYVFGKSLHLPNIAWNTLTKRFIVFFSAMAIINELVWRNTSTDVWVNFKLFGFMGLTFVFLLSQIPFIHKNSQESKVENT